MDGPGFEFKRDVSPITNQSGTLPTMTRIVPPMRYPPLALVLLMCSLLSGCSGCYAAPQPNVVSVMIDVRDLPPGVTIQEADIQVVEIPRSDLPLGTPRRRSEVLGNKSLVPITKGMLIPLSDLTL